VVGRPDERLGEEVAAFVSLVDCATASEADLIEFSKGRLAAHKYPRTVTVLPRIPLTSVGKVDRRRLRAAVRRGSGGSAVESDREKPESPRNRSLWIPGQR
jgi:long-chain acyl-CoA synthetase